MIPKKLAPGLDPGVGTGFRKRPARAKAGVMLQHHWPRRSGEFRMSRHIVLILAAALASASAVRAQEAADYPDRPIRIIVTVPAGGGVDTVTRIVGDGLQRRWGQPVVVDNRGGAGGNIGAE